MCVCVRVSLRVCVCVCVREWVLCASGYCVCVCGWVYVSMCLCLCLCLCARACADHARTLQEREWEVTLYNEAITAVVRDVHSRVNQRCLLEPPKASLRWGT